MFTGHTHLFAARNPRCSQITAGSSSAGSGNMRYSQMTVGSSSTCSARSSTKAIKKRRVRSKHIALNFLARGRFMKKLLRLHKPNPRQPSSPLAASLAGAKPNRTSGSRTPRSIYASLPTIVQHSASDSRTTVVLGLHAGPFEPTATAPDVPRVRYSHPAVNAVITSGPMTAITVATTNSVKTDTPLDTNFPRQVNPLKIASGRDSSVVQSMNRTDGFKKDSQRVSGIKLPRVQHVTGYRNAATASRQSSLPPLPYQPFSVPGIPTTPTLELEDDDTSITGFGDTPPAATLASKFTLAPIPYLPQMTEEGLLLPADDYVKAADLREEASRARHADADTYLKMQRKRNTVVVSEEEIAALPAYLRGAGDLPPRRKQRPVDSGYQEKVQPSEAEVRRNHKRLTEYHERCNFDNASIASSVYSQDVQGHRIPPGTKNATVARKPLPGPIARKPVASRELPSSEVSRPTTSGNSNRPRLSKPLPALPPNSPLPRSLCISQSGPPQRRPPPPPPRS